MSVFTQFAPNSIKSIQRGAMTISGSDTSGSSSITSVDTTKSILSFLGSKTGSLSATDGQGALSGLSATSVSGVRSINSSSTCNIYWQVVEYY